MSKTLEVRVPDIGDFTNVPVVEIFVNEGDKIELEDPLVSLESDKATMDIPSPVAGIVTDLKILIGDKVSKGQVLMIVSHNEALEEEQSSESKAAVDRCVRNTFGSTASATAEFDTDLVVIGAGPGGYTAAFRAADLGLSTVLVEKHPSMGGVCLNVGCIPSKALLHVAGVLGEVQELSGHGIHFQKPDIDICAIRKWKQGIILRLTDGLQGLARQRKIKVVQGMASFRERNILNVTTAEGDKNISFGQAIIAVGSKAVQLPCVPAGDSRIMDSTTALEINDIPERLLVIGGGIIGLEMATVYNALGSRVVVTELMDQLIPGADRDIVRPLHQSVEKKYQNIHLRTKVVKVDPNRNDLQVTFRGPAGEFCERFDKILVAVGRAPNSVAINVESSGIVVDRNGFISVDDQMRTNLPHIFAIGDVVGQPMLAHKAVYEAKVAAEVASGLRRNFDARVIPSVAYTDPEVAWVGLTEEQAKSGDFAYEKSMFPWAASGRAITMNREQGLTKLLFDKETKKVIGAGIVGPNAGELISELALAIEMGCDAEDLSLTIHPHPTLSETIGMAGEIFEGTITDLYLPKFQKKEKISAVYAAE